MDTIDRREFLRQMLAASAYASLLPSMVFTGGWTATGASLSDVVWKKSPCRFCGTGCGLLVGLSKGRAVAVKGDPASPVNRGLLCVKGYNSVLAMYGQDRLKHAYVRKDGKLEQVPMKEALDLVARKMQETIAAQGKDSVAMYGSGQWTIPDGYVASKFMKGAIGTNNIEANARLCMASAVTGFMSTFGMDEPMGCYEDIDHADVFVLWGNNMSEMHPVLFSRILERKAKNPGITLVELATRKTRTSTAMDHSLQFRPQTDLAIANAICQDILAKGKANQEFLEQHCVFKKGKIQIGFGLADDFKFQDAPEASTLEEWIQFLRDYTPEKAAELSGVPAEDIRRLAALYADPKRKVMSVWCMGVNQHTRGTWMNNLIYDIHLLVGKIAQPGNGPFSLTGQPSACGTVREVGTLTNRLPSGMVTDEAARKKAAEIWQVPVERIPAKPTHHAVSMFRALDRGNIRFMWIQVTNPMVSMPNLRRYRDGAKKEDRFIVVSEVYPTPTTEIADVILPSAMWVEREGMFGNSERRTQHWEKMIDPPGEALSDTWQIIEVARRMGFTDLFPWDEKDHIRQIWEEYRRFHQDPKHALAPYEELVRRAGVIWPFVDGKETRWRYNPQYDPVAKGPGIDFYGTANHRAAIWLRPYEAPPEEPDADYPYWLNTGRVLEHWHTGSMTRRVPVLHQAVPRAYVELNPRDASKLGVRTGDRVRLTSRRGTIVLPASIGERGETSQGQVFVPFFDESMLVNEVTLDAYCPISAQPDYKKCAVQVERA